MTATTLQMVGNYAETGSLTDYNILCARIKDLERLELFISTTVLSIVGKELTPEQSKVLMMLESDAFEPPQSVADLLAIIEKALQ